MATDPESRQGRQKDRLNVIWVIVALVVFALLQMLGIPNMAFT